MAEPALTVNLGETPIKLEEDPIQTPTLTVNLGEPPIKLEEAPLQTPALTVNLGEPPIKLEEAPLQTDENNDTNVSQEHEMASENRNNQIQSPTQAVPKQIRRYQCYKYSNEQLQLALEKCRQGLSIRECSKRYGVPKSTLWDKLARRTPPEMTRKGRCVVTQDVENRLVNWILKMNEDGFDVNEAQVKEAVKLFLDKTNNGVINKSNRPGKAWYKSFLLRHPTLYHIKNDDIQREMCSDEKLQKWFDESLDTEVPVFITAPVEEQTLNPEMLQPPPVVTSTIHQIKSVLEYMELTIGQTKTQYFKYCNDKNHSAVEDPMYSAWKTLADHVASSQVVDANHSTTHARKRKRTPKHLVNNYLAEPNTTKENRLKNNQNMNPVKLDIKESTSEILESIPELNHSTSLATCNQQMKQMMQLDPQRSLLPPKFS